MTSDLDHGWPTARIVPLVDRAEWHADEFGEFLGAQQLVHPNLLKRGKSDC
jgi:hypothetical protein